MKYVLILSFRAQIYRYEPRVRVYFRDVMIDEFHVPEHKFDDIRKPMIHSYVVEVPRELKETEIKLKILNHDNNWTNGFMTKDTNIWLEEIHFFPEPAMKNLYNFNSRANPIHRRMEDIKLRLIGNDNTQEKNGMFNLIEYVSFHRIEGLHKGEEVKNIKHLKFGGSGYYSVKLYKKYGMLIAKNMQYPRKFWIKRPAFIQKVYDRIKEMFDI
jgi:hypothetical protein